jgi:V/A-type H+/Na+-transporting ATPase subunit E
MSNKLQELTDKLYQEGLSKGKQEADEMKEKAKVEAAKIISEAKAKAQIIVSEGEREAIDIRTKAENDIKMASVQSISAIKQQVENIIITKSLSSSVKKSMNDIDFVKSLILTVIKAFNASNAEPVALNLILPENMQKEFSSFIQTDAVKEMNNGIAVSYSKNLAGGFKIGPKDDGYIISFSDEDFEKILSDYLRPATKKILFGC